MKKKREEVDLALVIVFPTMQKETLTKRISIGLN
jgi:hypothetical protein